MIMTQIRCWESYDPYPFQYQFLIDIGADLKSYHNCRLKTVHDQFYGKSITRILEFGQSKYKFLDEGVWFRLIRDQEPDPDQAPDSRLWVVEQI